MSVRARTISAVCKLLGAWEFTGPETVLFNENGNLVGTHGAGPSWSSTDGSTVIGTVKGRVDAPQSGDIPWLLVSTKPNDKPGTFSSVTGIHRVNTRGGVSPSRGCTSQDNVGSKSAVDYSADYVFLAAR